MDFVKFSSIQMSDPLKKSIAEIGYDVATSIQSQAIPVILNGKDVIGLSQTGSGKTAAFGVPIVDRVDLSLDPRMVQALIVCPTRELALQSCGELRKFAKYKEGVNIVSVFGGDSFSRQLTRLKTGCQIVVGTPGRIMDHMRRRTLHLEEIRTVVLDEADEMLKMGFLEDIETILASTPESRQMLLFSATMPREIMNITARFQKEPVTIKIEHAQKTVSTIEQYYTVLPRGKKNETLYSLIEFYKPGAAIVFCNTKKMVDELVEELNRHHYAARGLHGDMRQNERTQVINEFRHHRFQLLIATDVVARGIDIDDVSLVLNYDLPQENEYYVHRIGRTGRAGKSGLAVSLVQNGAQLRQVMEIARYANCQIERLAIPTKKQILQSNTEAFCAEIRGFLAGEQGEKYGGAVAGLMAEGYSAEQLAAGLFAMAMKQRSDYDETAEDVGELFVEHIRPEQGKNRGRPSVKKRPRCEPGCGTRPPSDSMAAVRISIGRKDKVAANHILGAAAGESGLPGKVFGAIRIDTQCTTLEVPKEYKDLVVNSLNDSKIKGIKVRARLV